MRTVVPPPVRDEGYGLSVSALPGGLRRNDGQLSLQEDDGRSAQSLWGEEQCKPRKRAEKQVERELALIAKLGLAGYFLIVWDIVEFCRKNGILVQGRGSAANSAVCYSLGITA